MSDAQAGFRTYIGLRYVPIIKGVWDNSIEYEALSIVVHQGNSYTSKKPVPIGVDINNDTYWVMTGNYNVQVANLEQQVRNAVNLIADYETDFANFEAEMKELYDNFQVDADGKIEERVTEIENRLNSQYTSFTAFVNNAVAKMRNDINTFETSTSQMVDAFEADVREDINKRFSVLTNQLEGLMTNFVNDYDNRLNNIQSQVNNLVLQAGNPEATSAEIAQAHATPYGDNATLLMALLTYNSNEMGYRKQTAPSQGGIYTLNLNTCTQIGCYYPDNTITKIDNTPLGLIDNNGFILIVSSNKTNNAIVQVLWLTGYRACYTRVRNSGNWTEWCMDINSFNGMNFTTLSGDSKTVYDFNQFYANTFLFFEGFSSIEYKPNNSPDILPNEPYSVMTFGKGEEKYQLCYTGTDNKCYFRHTISEVWTSWEGFVTDTELYDSVLGLRNSLLDRIALKKNGVILNDLEETSLSDFNDLTITNNSINTVKFEAGVLGTSAVVAYVFTITDGNDVKQTFVDTKGNTYYRVKSSGTWSNIHANAPINNLTFYTIFTVEDFNVADLDENKINLVKFGNGIIPSVSGTTICEVIQKTDTTYKFQKITCLVDGSVYTRRYSNGIWSALDSPYYTKAEIDAMLNP